MTSSTPALALALRLAVTVAAIAVALALDRSLFRDAVGAARARLALACIAIVSAAASHVGVFAQPLARVFPIGLVVGLGLAVLTLRVRSIRDAFDRCRDGDVRLLVGARAAFGSMILGFGALGVLPGGFALSAGLGDIVVASIAIAAPGSLARDGRRAMRALVHGVGLLDMIMVVAEAMIVVRPWALAHPGLVTMVTLPWLVVPIMVAVDLHGLRKVLFAPHEQSAAEPRRDGPQPARRLRGALP